MKSPKTQVRARLRRTPTPRPPPTLFDLGHHAAPLFFLTLSAHLVACGRLRCAAPGAVVSGSPRINDMVKGSLDYNLSAFIFGVLVPVLFLA